MEKQPSPLGDVLEWWEERVKLPSPLTTHKKNTEGCPLQNCLKKILVLRVNSSPLVETCWLAGWLADRLIHLICGRALANGGALAEGLSQMGSGGLVGNWVAGWCQHGPKDLADFFDRSVQFWKSKIALTYCTGVLIKWKYDRSHFCQEGAHSALVPATGVAHCGSSTLSWHLRFCCIENSTLDLRCVIFKLEYKK